MIEKIFLHLFFRAKKITTHFCPMLQTHFFTFNPFQENTYILFDETNECVIIDPGCSTDAERNELTQFISSNKLKPFLLLNTHSHLDHMLGNSFIKQTYNIPFLLHKNELPILHSAVETGRKYGVVITPSPEPDRFIEDEEIVRFGKTELKTLYTPGHAPGEVSFYHIESKTLIAGDVLFNGSIGRYDFPLSDYESLMQSIFNKLLVLPDDVKVYSGHGSPTTIGKEKRSNPYLLEYAEGLK